MARVPRRLVDPEQPLSIVEQLSEIQDVVDRKIEFGHPSHPEDISSVLAAGVTSTSHNGYTENIAGSWVELKFGDVVAGAHKATAYHNLFQDDPNYTLPVAGVPNVRWLVFGFSHSGNTVDAASTLSVAFDESDSGSVAANSIKLSLNFGGTRVVSDAEPVTVTLFFVRAARGMLETAA